ncbi:unnamed protein product [Xylocopa violacea]|uniref:Tetratricopeptide repeat protein 29 n=1 Tax=Xylocopa violacea TaxID=135666 RepID=A0ABP1PIG3_XYLVO
MKAKYKREKEYVVEFVAKNDRTGWSNSSSDSKINEYIIDRPKQLKTLPQAERNEINKVIAELKALLPDISPEEVRRHYIPYHEAILLELEEQGYLEALHRMKEFLETDEKIVEKTPGMLTWKKPYLKDQKDFINCLQDGLITSERSKMRGDHVTRATSLLDTALYFQSKTWEWQWITERLYQAALSAAELIEHDDAYTITLIRYLYGRFLFYELQNPKEALDYLRKARDGSANKLWNASKILCIEQNSIFKECSGLLYKALLILARKERPKNAAFAVEACIEALSTATDTENTEYINEGYYELGKCYVATNDIKSALQCFSKLLALAKRTMDIEGVCNAHMELAFAYKQLNDNDYTEKHLQMCRESAENFCFFEKLADAHYYIGEHYLSQGKLYLSTSNLETALNLYNRLDLSSEADRARCIAGISKGQERIEEYLDLLLQCGEYNENATLKLCQWKSNREPFWIEEIHEIKSDFEIQYETSDTFLSSSSVRTCNDRAMSRP